MSGDSPWAHDDWLPDDHDPIEFDRPRGDRGRSEGAGDRGGPGARWAFGVGAVIVVFAVAVALLARDPRDRAGDADSREVATTVTSTLASVVSSAVDTTVDDVAPPTEPTTTPAPAVEEPLTFTLRSGAEGRQVRAFDTSVIGERPELERVVDGEIPLWTEWWIEVPEALATIEPVELLLVARAVLHRVELPAGRVESISIIGEWDGQTQVGRLANGAAYSAFGTLWVLVDGQPAAAVNVGQNQQLLSLPSGAVVARTFGASTATWLVDGHGVVTDVSASIPQSATEIGVNRNGELVVAVPGGVYAVEPAGGAARRLSVGGLRALGVGHALVERCDEVLRCEIVLIDTDTAEASVPNLVDSPLEGRFTSQLSPDGGHVVVFDSGSPAGWTVVGLTAGAAWELGYDVSPILTGGGALHWSWLPDSSAVLMTSRPDGAIVLVGVDGAVTEIAEMGTILDVVVAPAPAVG